MRNYLASKYAPLAAFLVIAFFGGWAIQASSSGASDKLYHSQIEACHRGNSLRQELTTRAESSNSLRSALLVFLKTARHARLDAYKQSGDWYEKRTANVYEQQIKGIEAHVVFKPISMVDCEAVIEKP